MGEAAGGFLRGGLGRRGRREVGEGLGDEVVEVFGLSEG
jgi:hypothetical protein